jgi:hypothetical protein
MIALSGSRSQPVTQATEKPKLAEFRANLVENPLPLVCPVCINGDEFAALRSIHLLLIDLKALHNFMANNQ